MLIDLDKQMNNAELTSLVDEEIYYSILTYQDWYEVLLYPAFSYLCNHFQYIVFIGDYSLLHLIVMWRSSKIYT